MKSLNPQQSERALQFSLADKNYDGNIVNYPSTLLKIGSLESILKQHNYSPISWYTDYRKEINFKSASAFCIDSDHGMTIEQALDELKKLGWNFALITTKSHTPEAHRFRIIIPFSKTIYCYKVYRTIIEAICKHFPQSDSAVFDGARQLFGSPNSATYYSRWDGNDFNVDPLLKDGEWDSNLRIFDATKKQLDINTIKAKTSIYCPFHDDSNASAFIEYSDTSKNHFIHCSSCGNSFWKIKEPLSMEERCKAIYSLGTGFHQLAITRGEFTMIEIGEKKTFSLVGAKSKEDKDATYDWLLQNHHFPDMTLVEQIGEVDAKGSYFEPLVIDGMVRVHHGAIPVKDLNNILIEEYLKDTFGDYSCNIKEWMAAYSYTNYKSLPFLILTGERGAGKNTFAELIGEIYKPLTMSWSGKPGTFTPEYEKKLLIADETVSDDPKQYLELKRISGKQYLPVNKKFKQQYEVRNNINVIILSNARYPIQMERDELPTSERDNQFFVYKMKKNYKTPDARFGEKLKNALGHYIRTELKTVYDGLKLNDYRYSISVPITEYEKELFDSSVSPEEDAMDKVLLKMKEDYSKPESENGKILNARFVPTDIFDEYVSVQKIGKHKLVKLLRAQGYLTGKKQDRPMVDSVRKYCYEATDKLTTYLSA